MAIDEIILHVGMHKTGTSAIQQAFDGYDDGEVAYADLKIPGNATPNHGVALETLFRPDFENVPHHKRHARPHKVVAGYRQQFEKRLDQQLGLNRKRLVFSGEGLPRLTAEQLTLIKKRFLQDATRVTILVYIRDPEGFAASMFQQHCKVGLQLRAGWLPLPQYRRKFRKFIRVFGAERVRFVHYSKPVLCGGSSVTDFAFQIGLPDAPRAVEANVGLSGDATRCLYILRRDPSLDFERLDSRLVLSRIVKNLEDHVVGDRFTLPNGTVAERMQEKDLDWINRKTGFDLALSDPDQDINLDHALREVSDRGQFQLRQMAGSLGISFSAGATVDEMMRQLYWHHHGRSRRRAHLRRGFDAVASRIGRVLLAVGGRKG